MKALKDILHGIPVRHVVGNLNVAVADLCFDSRKVTPNSMFVAVVGTQVDGHRYVENAITLGAAVILCERIPEEARAAVTSIQVEDTPLALGVSASDCFAKPSAKLKLVGVTGTNGKTPSSTLLYQLSRQLGYGAGLMSPVQN